ncbi:MAG: hypothetical protein QM778_28155 [Myxococcales bacterium]
MILFVEICFGLAGCGQFALVGVAPAEAGPAGDGPTDAAFDGHAQASDGSTTSDADSARCDRQVDVCNPVTNTGCSEALVQRCAPDLSSAKLAGYCTFMGEIPDGGLECFNSVVTESCPPKSTCHNGACRSLCFCDADCGDGQCCTEPLGEQGFAVCAPC